MRRFYKSAEAGEHEGVMAVLLDGRPVRTPNRALLHLPTEALALAAGPGPRADRGEDVAQVQIPRR